MRLNIFDKSAFKDDNITNLAALTDHTLGTVYITQDGKAYVSIGSELIQVGYLDSTDTDTLIKTQNASAFDGTFTSATIESAVTNIAANVVTLGTKTQAQLTDTATKGHTRSDTGTTATDYPINRSSGTKKTSFDVTNQTANVVLDTDIIGAVLESRLIQTTYTEFFNVDPDGANNTSTTRITAATTSNTDPYTLTVVNQFPDTAWKALDNSTSTHWELSTTGAASIMIDMGTTSVIINKFRFMFNNAAFDDFYIQGSYDGVTFHELYHDESVAFPGSGVWSGYFTFRNGVKWNYYKIGCDNAATGAEYLREVDLIGISGDGLPQHSVVVYLTDLEEYAQYDITSQKLYNLITYEEID